MDLDETLRFGLAPPALCSSFGDFSPISKLLTESYSSRDFHSLFYHSVLDMLFKLCQNLFVMMQLHKDTIPCHWSSPFMTSLSVSFMKHQNSLFILKASLTVLLWSLVDTRFELSLCHIIMAVVGPGEVLLSYFSSHNCEQLCSSWSIWCSAVNILVLVCCYPIVYSNSLAKAAEQSDALMCKKAEG